MKKLTLLTLLVFSTLSLFAHDIIVTRASEKIESIIEEISDTEVRYKKADKPTGPTFVISTEKISTIIFNNGDVQVFETASVAAPQVRQNQQVQQTQPAYLPNYYDPVTRDVVTMPMYGASQIVYVPGQQIIRNGRGNYQYGAITMTESLYKDFIQMHCPAAYQKYQSGSGICIAGSVILGAGLGMALGSVWSRYSTVLVVGLSGMCAGIVVGVPLICVGAHMSNVSYKVFNEQCASRPARAQLQLSINAYADGIGVALHF